MRLFQLLKVPFALALIIGVAAAGYFTRERWLPIVQRGDTGAANVALAESAVSATSKILLADQAIKNLSLVAKPVQTTTFWKTITVPGMVIDRPGQSDRNLVAPVTGVITRVHHVPGDTVRPGATMFTLKLLNETLYLAQSELFKAGQDIKLAQGQRVRLQAAAGAVPESRMIELDGQIARLEATVKAYRQELLTRGLTPAHLESVVKGEFVSEISVVVPQPGANQKPLTEAATSTKIDELPTFEMQELKVDLGQQVQAGQTLCLLSNHQSLAIEGRAFRDETPLLERSVQAGWPVEVDFLDDGKNDWPALSQPYVIRYMANTIDPVNRTFAFQMPLENQSRVVERDGRTQLLWRFRPGQRVRIEVRVERLDNVFVLPAAAVTRDGPEAYVFTQNVNTFERKPVRLLILNRREAVLANDGTLVPGSFVVQLAAAQLNRMTKSQSSGAPQGYHIHADGSLHKNGEPE